MRSDGYFKSICMCNWAHCLLDCFIWSPQAYELHETSWIVSVPLMWYPTSGNVGKRLIPGESAGYLAFYQEKFLAGTEMITIRTAWVDLAHFACGGYKATLNIDWSCCTRLSATRAIKECFSMARGLKGTLPILDDSHNALQDNNDKVGVYWRVFGQWGDAYCWRLSDDIDYVGGSVILQNPTRSSHNSSRSSSSSNCTVIIHLSTHPTSTLLNFNLLAYFQKKSL